MEILKLYGKAASELDNALSSCKESDVNISSITLILSDKGNIYTGFNWKRLNDSLSVEETCSEYEAIIKLLLAGESVIDTIITLNAKTKLPVNPCHTCQELIIKINPENKSCKVVSGRNSQVTLTSLNTKYDESPKEPDTNTTTSDKTEASSNKKPSKNNRKASLNNEPVPDETKTDAPVTSENESANTTVISETASDKPAESADASAKKEINDAKPAEPDASGSSKSEDTSNNNSMDICIVDYDEPENSTEAAPHSSVIDTAGLKMIFDDWETEKAPETTDNLNLQSNKPFNVNSLSSQQISNTLSDTENKQAAFVQKPADNGMMYQQQTVNNMYQQQTPVNNMYQQQSPVNNMYQQQPPVNNMYQQQQQPVNNPMYQQQPPVNNSMYSQIQAPVTPSHAPANNSLYMNQMPPKPTNSQFTNTNYQTPNNIPSNSTHLNQMQAPVPTPRPNSTVPSQSVYGTNINSGDNNAIFKDRLNNILTSSTTKSSSYEEEAPIEEAIKSIKDKKKAAKIDAKFIKRQKKNGNL